MFCRGIRGNDFLQISRDRGGEDLFLGINILVANLGIVRITETKIMAATHV